MYHSLSIKPLGSSPAGLAGAVELRRRGINVGGPLMPAHAFGTSQRRSSVARCHRGVAMYLHVLTSLALGGADVQQALRFRRICKRYR